MVHTMAGDGTIADDVIDNNVRRSTANPPAAATTATSRRHHHRSCSGDNVEVGRGTEMKTYRNNSSLRFILYCAIGLCVTVSVLNYPSRFMTSYYSEDVPNHNVLTVPSFPTSRQRHSNNNSNDNDNSNSNNNNTNNNRGTSDSVGIDHRHHNNTTTRTKTKTSNTAAPTIPTIPGTGTTTGTTTTIDRIRDNDPVDTKTKKEKKNILYVHFHKGTYGRWDDVSCCVALYCIVLRCVVLIVVFDLLFICFATIRFFGLTRFFFSLSLSYYCMNSQHKIGNGCIRIVSNRLLIKLKRVGPRSSTTFTRKNIKNRTNIICGNPMRMGIQDVSRDGK